MNKNLCFIFTLFLMFFINCGNDDQNNIEDHEESVSLPEEEKIIEEIIIPEDWRNIDTGNLPPWVALEYGKLAFREKEYGYSLIFFRKALEKKRIYPEAEMWIGAVFQKESEYLLAEKQYQKAYEQRNELQINDDKFRILYKLAFLYQNWEKKEKNYQDTLIKIVEDEKYSIEYFNDKTAERIIKIFKSKGINKLLELYRINVQFPLKAHKELGEFYFKTGRYWDSMLNFLYSVLIPFSIAIEEFRILNPQYEFEDVGSFLNLIMNDEHTSNHNYICTPVFKEKIKNYFYDTDLFNNLLFLGKALCAESGYFTVDAKRIWNIIIKYSKNDYLINKAENYLNTNKLEQILR